MEATILNTVYNYNSLNPTIELFISHSPYLIKLNQTFLDYFISLKSIHIEKLIGCKIKFEFLKKGEKLNNFSDEICKYENSYFKYLEFDTEYISKNENEIKFLKITRKEFYFAKIKMDPILSNYYKYMYVPRLNLYSDSILISKIDILSKPDFYICLFTEINIFRKKGCTCENCLEIKSDCIDVTKDEITIDVRIETSEIKKIKNLNIYKKKRIDELCERLHEKSYRTFSTLDENLLKDLNLFIKSQL